MVIVWWSAVLSRCLLAFGLMPMCGWERGTECPSFCSVAQLTWVLCGLQMHYTWGTIFKANGTEIWQFDK